MNAAARIPTTNSPLITTNAIKIGEVPLELVVSLAMPPLAAKLLISLVPDEPVAEEEAVELRVEVGVLVGAVVGAVVGVELEEDDHVVDVNAAGVPEKAVLEGFALPGTTGWCCRVG